MWGDILSYDEVQFCRQLRSELEGVAWARKLLSSLPPTEALRREDKSRLFELRVAGALHHKRLSADYEFRATGDKSTVDFRVASAPGHWLIEAVSLSTSKAVQDATWTAGMTFGAELSSDAVDVRQSEEGEILLAQQKIVAKTWREGRPTKFPPLQHNVVSAILVDMRAFALGHPDVYDFREIAYGVSGLQGRDYLAHGWTDPKTGKKAPIAGLFEDTNPLRGSPVLRERIHFVGFCCETKYERASLPSSTYWVSNPALFPSAEDAARCYAGNPLRVDEDNQQPGFARRA